MTIDRSDYRTAMNIRLPLHLLVFSLAVLSMSCGQSFDLTLQPEVTVYFSDDRNKTISLTSRDKAYTELDAWLSENNSNWYTTSGRYPGGVYIKSGDYGIQVTRTQVVIYSATESETLAIYTQNLEGGELKSVKNLGK